MVGPNDHHTGRGQEHSQKRLWQCVRQTEQSQQMLRRVKKALGTTTQHAGLTQVTGPTKDNMTTWTCYTTKMEIEHACLDEAQR